MARYNHLPIYKEAYRLTLALMELSRSLPRDFKYSIGEKLQNHALDLIVDIYRANSAIEKFEYINSIIEHAQFIGLFLRLSMDMKIISEQRYSNLVEIVTGIERQATAWNKG